MTDAAFIAAAYGVGALGLVGYAVSLARRERSARTRQAALERARDRVAGPIGPGNARLPEEGRLPAPER
ncbi:MAG: hypothetical protein M0Z49_00390 [Chloroflexi bacterium]|nr:hypothetical protein [Chloroflexota bacterium]